MPTRGLHILRQLSVFGVGAPEGKEPNPKCHTCGKEIEPSAQFWLREPDEYDDKGFVTKRSKPIPFCGLACIFGWSGKMLRKQKGVGKENKKEESSG